MINKAVAAKAVDTTELRKAQRATQGSLQRASVHAEDAGIAIDNAEAIVLPARAPSDAVAVPLAAVTLSVDQIVAIQRDFEKARTEIKSLRGELVASQVSNNQAETQAAAQQERADNLAAADLQKTRAINEAKGELAKSEKEKAEAGGALSTYRKLFFGLLALVAIYLFLKISPWTRAFIP